MNGIESDEQREARIRALIEERAAYVSRLDDDGVAAVDEQLALLGHEGAAPAKRATSRKPSATKRA